MGADESGLADRKRGIHEYTADGGHRHRWPGQPGSLVVDHGKRCGCASDFDGMSARALDTSQSTELRPILLDTPGSIRALTPGVPVLGRVELTKFSYAFRRGSRIRIWIDTPSATGGNDFNHLSIRSMNSVWHDAGHPSRLVLGVLSDVKVPAQRAACDA